jgi:hypothetical protein
MSHSLREGRGISAPFIGSVAVGLVEALMHRHLGRRPCGWGPPRESAWPLHRASQRKQAASRRAEHTTTDLQAWSMPPWGRWAIYRRLTWWTPPQKQRERDRTSLLGASAQRERRHPRRAPRPLRVGRPASQVAWACPCQPGTGQSRARPRVAAAWARRLGGEKERVSRKLRTRTLTIAPFMRPASAPHQRRARAASHLPSTVSV